MCFKDPIKWEKCYSSDTWPKVYHLKKCPSGSGFLESHLSKRSHASKRRDFSVIVIFFLDSFLQCFMGGDQRMAGAPRPVKTMDQGVSQSEATVTLCCEALLLGLPWGRLEP